MEGGPAQLLGRIIPHTYEPGYVVLSYLVSFCGCWTALELLYRRTGTDGHQNWYLLLAAAVAMASVGIWSMHFIGNRAINLAGGKSGFQIEYSPGFTAGSFFLPICGVGVAFYFFSISENVGVGGTLAGGLMLGMAICGMHYMGNGGVSNYSPSYDWEYVLGSAIIAVAASTVALRIFFHFKAKWTNTWLKRALCAALLATAVSGMHWVATAGTHYRLQSLSTTARGGLSRQATVVVVICLSVGACLVLLTYAFIAQRARLRTSHRARQVVLASVTFDEEGRLLVTPSGLIPSRKITNEYMQRAFGDRFDVEHPVFCWCFRASRCWQTVAQLVPAIRSRLRVTEMQNPTNRRRFARLSHADQMSEDRFTRLFKELFLVTANDLADSIQEPLTSLGTLFDEILSTGTEHKLRSARKVLTRGHRPSSQATKRDIEASPDSMLFGRGQVLFLVRKVQKSDALRLQASGFTFARGLHIIDLLVKNMEVNKEVLERHLNRMREFALSREGAENALPVHVFALKPLYNRGFDIVVRNGQKDKLPSVNLPMVNLQSWQVGVLESLSDCTVKSLREQLRGLSISLDNDQKIFAGQLLEALANLSHQIGSPFLEEARLTVQTLDRTNTPEPNGSSPTLVIALRHIIDAHDQSVLGDMCELTPLKLFLCRQHMPPRGSQDDSFSQQLSSEFAYCLDHHLAKDSMPPTSPSRFLFRHSSAAHSPSLGKMSSSFAKRPRRVPSFGCYPLSKDDSSERSLVLRSPSKQTMHVENHQTASDEGSEGRRDLETKGLEMNESAFFGPVEGSKDSEEESYADRLLATTLRDQRKS